MPILDAIEFLTTTVDAGSFAAAARKLGVTPSAVSRRVANLEAELGVALLARTTRRLRLTDDGLAFHARCAQILEQLHEARAVLARARHTPVGTLRVDAGIALGRSVIAPALPRFLERYPEIRLDLTLHDQLVDPIAEGLDVLVRIGPLGDSSLIARRLGESRIVLCASPGYLQKRGTPATLGDLARHDGIGYLRGGHPIPLRFEAADGVTELAITGRANANDAEVIRQLAIAGRGIAGLFEFIVANELASGQLVTVLDAHRSTSWPIHALYPRNRHLLPKVSVFVAFLEDLFGARPRDRRDRRETAAGATLVAGHARVRRR